jgi:hypothetical protein
MYRATALTQRDGSSLQNANCRMTAIAVGLDFDTLGKKKSSGGKMRGYTTDQSGGTDSSDAREAWVKGYKETLIVRDGQPWNEALEDLRDGRLVHLDVWHAGLAGASCVSGEGRYGHSIAVAPEHNSAGQWLVSDPWCKPGRWTWISERTLRLAAEDWGSRVFNRSTKGRSSPLPPVGSVELGLILAAMARYLMGLYKPGEEAPPGELPPTDTGGPPPIMYTVTAAHPEEEPMSLQFDIISDYGGTVTVKDDDLQHAYLDLTTGKLADIPGGAVKPAYAKIKVQKGTILGDTDARRTGYLIGVSAAMLLEQDVTLQPVEPTDQYVPAGTLYLRKE